MLADKSYVEGDKNGCIDLDVKSTEYAIKAFECFFRAVTFCPVSSPSARKKLIEVVQKIEKDNNLLPDEKGLECPHGFQSDFIGSNWKRVLMIGVHHCKLSLKDKKIIEDLSVI